MNQSENSHYEPGNSVTPTPGVKGLMKMNGVKGCDSSPITFYKRYVDDIFCKWKMRWTINHSLII